MRLHTGAVLDVDREAISDLHQRLVDGRGGVALALDRDLVADAELALLDPGNLVPRRVLKDEGLSDSKRLPLTLKARSPSPFSIQWSSPIDSSAGVANRALQVPRPHVLDELNGADLREVVHALIDRARAAL